MFVVILFLLGLCFGYAMGWPKALFAFVVPLALLAAATNRSAGATIFGFALVGVGLLVGLALAAREREGHTASAASASEPRPSAGTSGGSGTASAAR